MWHGIKTNIPVHSALDIWHLRAPSLSSYFLWWSQSRGGRGKGLSHRLNGGQTQDARDRPEIPTRAKMTQAIKVHSCQKKMLQVSPPTLCSCDISMIPRNQNKEYFHRDKPSPRDHRPLHVAQGRAPITRRTRKLSATPRCHPVEDKEQKTFEGRQMLLDLRFILNDVFYCFKYVIIHTEILKLL